MPTIRQIAEMTNVSRGTVDRVINNRGGVNAETEKKVRAAIDALNYLPNKAGRNLALRKKGLKFAYIIFSPSSYNPFFEGVEIGINKKSRELEELGVQVNVQRTNFNDANQQLELLDHFAETGYDGIAITALNTPEISAKIKELSERGIPIITANTDVPNSHRLAYVGSNYYKCGEVAANMMGLITDGKAKTGIISGLHNIMCLTERNAGFNDYLTRHYPNCEVVSKVNNNRYDEIESYLLTKEMLEKHPELDSLFLAAAGAGGACRAIVDSGRLIKVITFDCVPATEAFLKKGVISAVIDQDPFYQGSKPLELLLEAATVGNDSIREFYYTDCIIKIQSN